MIRKKRLGNIESLQSDLAQLEQDLRDETNEEAKVHIRNAINSVKKQIAEAGGASASNDADECQKLRAENRKLRDGLANRKKASERKRRTKTPQGGGAGGKAKTPKTPSDGAGGKSKTPKTPSGTGSETKKTKTQGDKTKTPKTPKTPSDGAGGKTKTPKTPKEPTEEQLKKRAAKEQKATEQRAKNEAKANGVSQKVATQLVAYTFVQSAIAKMLRYKGKRISYQSAYNFYQDILLANKAGKFSKNTPAFPLVSKIFMVLEENLNTSTFKTNKGGDISEDFAKADWDTFGEIAELNRGFLTAKFANEFVSISKTGNTTKAKDLAKRIANAEKRGAFDANTPFYNEMKEAEKKANAGEFNTLSASLKGIAASIKGLNGVLAGIKGVSGLGCTCQDYAKQIGELVEEDAGKSAASHNWADEQASMTAPEIRTKEYEYYDFEGKWGDLFRYPQINMTAMVYGNPGAGKSSLSLQLAQYLADCEGLHVLYVTAEEYDSKTLQDNLALNGVDNEHIVFTSHYEGHDLAEYDFVFLDSVQRLHLTQDDFQTLRNEYPNTAFVLIFQVTKDGNFKGEKNWEHDVDAVVHVKNGEAKNNKRYSGNETVPVFEN